jgi:hypothetical protein
MEVGERRVRNLEAPNTWPRSHQCRFNNKSLSRTECRPKCVLLFSLRTVSQCVFQQLASLVYGLFSAPLAFDWSRNQPAKL